MKTQLKNVLLVIGMLILLVSACGPLGSESTPPIAPEPIVEATEAPTSVPTEVAAEEPVLPVASSYVGMVYPPVPADLTQGFSMIIQGTDGFGLSLVSDGGYKMLWLSKVVQYDASGSPLWEVKDVLPLSNLEADLTLLPDGCFLNGAPVSEIFVAGRNGVIVLAWRADTTLGVFEVIPTDGIQCNSDKAVGLD